MKTVPEYSKEMRHAVSELLYDYFSGVGVAVYLNGELDSRLDELLQLYLARVIDDTLTYTAHTLLEGGQN